MSNSTEVVRLFDEGKTPPQIASILDLPEERVHAFLESRRVLLANPDVGIVREILRGLTGRDAEPCISKTGALLDKHTTKRPKR